MNQRPPPVSGPAAPTRTAPTSAAKSPPTMRPLQAQPGEKFRPSASNASRPATTVAPTRPFQPALGVSPIHYRPRPTNAVAGPGPSSVAAASSASTARGIGPTGSSIGSSVARPGSGIRSIARPVVASAARPQSTKSIPTSGATSTIARTSPSVAISETAANVVRAVGKPATTPAPSTNPRPTSMGSNPSDPSLISISQRSFPPETTVRSTSPSVSTAASKRKHSDLASAPARSQDADTIVDDNNVNGDPSGSAARNKSKSVKVKDKADGNSSTGAISAEHVAEGEKEAERETKRRRKEAKKDAKKARACIYCRRSHMVCDATRPCTRCNKRGIEHLCVADAKSAGYELDPTKPGEVYHLVGVLFPGDSHETTNGDGHGNGSGHGGGAGNGRMASDVGAADNAGGNSAKAVVPNKDKRPRNQSRDASASGQKLAQDPASNWTGQDGRPAGSLQRRQSDLDISSADESGPDRELERDGFVQAQQTYVGSAPTNSIYDAGGGLPPAMALHPAWPLLPNNNMMASIPDDVSGSQLGSYAWGNNGLESGGGAEGQGEGTPQNADDYTAMQEFFESLGIPNLPGGIGDIFGMSANRFEGPPDNAGLPIISSASNPSIFARTSVTASNGSAADPTVVGMRSFGDGNDALRNPPLFTARDPEMDIAPGGGVAGFPSAENRFGSTNVTGFMESDRPLLGKVSKAERYLLAAADQASGTRDERLAQVIKAKYDAGLLKPYDYSRSYARFYRWMEKNVSSATKQAILRPLSVFRPAFRAIAQTLSDIDLVFVEEAFERLMLDYDRVFSAIHTPSCLWRRTGEIYKANKEFSVLTGIPTAWLRGGRVGIYQLMTEDSLLRYYELLGSMAFDSGRRSVNTTCTLRIPSYLTKAMTPQTPLFGPTAGVNLSNQTPLTTASPRQEIVTPPVGSPSSGKLPSISVVQGMGSSLAPSAADTLGAKALASSDYSTVKCCFSFTIRRDSWGIPTAIIGNWIPV